MGIAIIGLLAIAFTPADPGPAGIAWRLALTATGFGLFFPPNARMVIGNSPRDRSAAAGGLLATSRLFGQTLGAATVGVLLSLGLGLGPAPMFVSVTLATIAALASLARHHATGGVTARSVT